MGGGGLRRPGGSAGPCWLWWVEAGGRVWLGVLRPVANNSAAVAPATGLARPLRLGLDREIIGGEEAAERERKGAGHQGEQESCQPVHVVYLSVRMDSTAKELLLFTFNYNLERKKQQQRHFVCAKGLSCQCYHLQPEEESNQVPILCCHCT